MSGLRKAVKDFADKQILLTEKLQRLENENQKLVALNQSLTEENHLLFKKVRITEQQTKNKITELNEVNLELKDKSNNLIKNQNEDDYEE